jgi:Xaa-Pro aminopeptidase
MRKIKISTLILLMSGIFLIGNAGAQLDWDISKAGDIDKILSERERARVFNEILEWRLDHILPEIMRREGIDLWLVINFEYNEDPVYMSLVAKPAFYARRLSILLFHDSPEGFKKLTANWHGNSSCGPMYTNIFTDRSKGANHQYTVVAEYVKKHSPKKIGINTAYHWDYHDDFSLGTGLADFCRAKLERALEPEYRKKLVSAEKICIGWLETRSPRELSLYRHLCGIAHDIIMEFFSNKVITPDVTETQDVVWWIRQRITDLGLETWFQPSISIHRSPKDLTLYGKGDRVIRRGDILHCDVGISYLGLCTDMQHNAYVCRIGEKEPPAGIKELYRRGNRVQEILLMEYKEGRTGNEILKSALEKARAEGLKPRIYTHPIGIHGHGSGMMVGMYEKQDFVPGTGEHPLYPNTVYSIELSAAYEIPEWGNTLVSLGFEEEAVFTKQGVNWVDGYPRDFYLIR